VAWQPHPQHTHGRSKSQDYSAPPSPNPGRAQRQWHQNYYHRRWPFLNMRKQPSGSLTSFQISVSLHRLNRGKTVFDDDVVLYSFSSCYGHDSRQEDIFEADVRPLIDVVYSGSVRSLLSSHFSPPEAKWMVKLDSHHLCVWRHVVWQDAYNARKSRATWGHSSNC